MNASPLIQHTILGIGAALLLSANVAAGGPVEREFIYNGGNVTIADTSITPGFMVWSIAEERGNGTHVGLYTCEGSGQINMKTGVNTGSGVLIAANGDEIFWSLLRVPGNATEFTIQGGTGRFENATGGWVGNNTTVEAVWNGTVLTVRQVSEGSGTICY